MSSKNKVVLYIVGAVAVIVIVWLVLDNLNKKTEIDNLKKGNDEKDDINKKLKDAIDESKDIPKEVKIQLEDLIQRYHNVDNNVRHELMTASSLIEIKQYQKAIAVLTKIIENLLKEKYEDNIAFKVKTKKNKYPSLKDYIEFAKDDKLLSPEEFHFANGLREIRNDDSHDLNPTKSVLLTSSAFLSAVDLILKISFKLNNVKRKITSK